MRIAKREWLKPSITTGTCFCNPHKYFCILVYNYVKNVYQFEKKMSSVFDFDPFQKVSIGEFWNNQQSDIQHPLIRKGTFVV